MVASISHRIARPIYRPMLRAARGAKAKLFDFRHETQPPAYFAQWPEARVSHKRLWKGAYRRYTTQVSKPGKAISLELASFLQFICEHIKPRVILDLGSGFSSYVFWQIQLQGGGEVYSVDTDPGWLERTRKFLPEKGEPTTNLFTWNDFYPAMKTLRPDLILHDLGNIAKRVEVMDHLSDFMSKNTHLILDDTHKRRVRDGARRWIKQRSLRYFNLEPYTRDELGRSQWYIIGES